MHDHNYSFIPFADHPNFAGDHPRFLDWKKLPFYSVAPDGSGVVYKAAGKLFWKRTVDGKDSTLANVSDVRGVQSVQSAWSKRRSTLSACRLRLLHGYARNQQAELMRTWFGLRKSAAPV